jgi:hypothetical protein
MEYPNIPEFGKAIEELRLYAQLKAEYGAGHALCLRQFVAPTRHVASVGRDAAEGQAESYEANLVNFIAHMREQFETPEMPFIIARVLSFYGGETGQAAIVRDAQVKVAEADPNADW